MDGKEFFKKIEKRGELSWLGVREGENQADDEVYIQHEPTGGRFAVPVSEILANEWEELEAILTGVRELRVLSHMTRITGYYSMVKDWNRSKKMELLDRGKGDYHVPESSNGLRDTSCRSQPLADAVAPSV